MPDGETSSADPQALFAYADAGLRIDAELEASAARLAAVLAEFAASCTEYPLGIDASLADPLRALAQRNVEQDLWVRSVAEQFVLADNGVVGSPVVAEDGWAPPPPSESSSSGIGDFLPGMWDEGKDMVGGLVNTVVHPITTVKGLWTAVTHPDLLWHALADPFVQDWNSGHPWRATGRGIVFIGSMLVGTKGADKMAKLAKLSQAADVTAGAATIGARDGSALKVAEALAKVDEGSPAEVAAAGYIAQQSTESYGAADRVVLGAYKADPAKNFLGYLGEARTYGGKAFNTGDPVWQAISPGDRAWVVNREFLQAQLEQNVPRIELKGTTVSEVLSNPKTAMSFRGQEVQHLQRYAYQYGYKLVNDNTWVKLGDWRATDAGCAVGASPGPLGDVLHASQVLAGDGTTP